LTRLRAHTEGIRHEGLIINTLLQMKNEGLAENTLKTVSQKLNQLSKQNGAYYLKVYVYHCVSPKMSLLHLFI